MTQHVPYQKLSKAKKRELNKRRRGTWGSLNPVTRKPPNPKAYRRKKMRRPEESFPDADSFLQMRVYG